MTLTAVLTPVMLDERGNPDRLPHYISFERLSRLFTVKDITMDDMGSWTVGLKLGYKEYPDFDVTCTASLTTAYHAEFQIIGLPW